MNQDSKVILCSVLVGLLWVGMWIAVWECVGGHYARLYMAGSALVVFATAIQLVIYLGRR